MNRILPLVLSVLIGVFGYILPEPVSDEAQVTVLNKQAAISKTLIKETVTAIHAEKAAPVAVKAAEAPVSIEITTAPAETTAAETTTAKEETTAKAVSTTTKETSTEAQTIKATTQVATETTAQPKTTVATTKAPETKAASKSKKGGMIWPADSDAIVTAGYPYYSSGASHGGIDIALYDGDGCNVTENTYILAAQDGVVVTAYNDGNWNAGFGNYCIIDHGNGIQTLYAHSNEIRVSEGDTVKQGQIIGLVGDTGNTTAPHLHFEVRKDCGNGYYERTNPLRYISEP